MPGLDDVLERLITDPAFRDRVATDRRAALAHYDLSPDDLSLLDAQVSTAAGGTAAMEGRTTKAGMFGLLGGLDEVLGAVGDAGSTDALVAGTGSAPPMPGGVSHVDDWDVGESPSVFKGEVVGIEPVYEATGDSAVGDTVDNDETITIHGNRTEADPVPTEQVSFNFEQIKVTYEEDSTGAGVGDVASADPAGSAAEPDDNHVTETVSFVYKTIDLEGPESPGPAGGGANEIAVEDTAGSAEAAASHEGQIDVESVSIGTRPQTDEGTVDHRDYVAWRKTDGAADDGSDVLAASGEPDPGAAGGDVVMKGSNIGENAPAAGDPALESSESGEASR
jgi:hypothetical protein